MVRTSGLTGAMMIWRKINRIQSSWGRDALRDLIALFESHPEVVGDNDGFQ